MRFELCRGALLRNGKELALTSERSRVVAPRLRPNYKTETARAAPGRAALVSTVFVRRARSRGICSRGLCPYSPPEIPLSSRPVSRSVTSLHETLASVLFFLALGRLFVRCIFGLLGRQ